MDILLAAFFLVGYLYLFLSFFYKRKSVFMLSLLSVITFYDFLFITISPYFSPTIFFIIKSWQEYLVLFLVAVLLLLSVKKPLTLSRFDRRFLIAFLLLTVICSFVGMMVGTSANQVFLGWRMYMLPLFWSFLLYKTGVMKLVPAKTIIYFLVLVSSFTVIYGVYQDVTFNGNLKSLWFYNFIDKLNPIEDHPFDFIRDEELRITGIFVSPLIYASFLSYALLIGAYYIFLGKPNLLKKTLAFFILLFLVYGQLLSRTRIGFIILLVGLCCSWLVYKRPSSKFIYSILIPLFFFAVTIISLIFGITEDLSALGRLIQYASVPSNFASPGLGFGAEMTNVFFDSFYISVTLLFGVFVPVYLSLYYFLLKKINGYSYFVKNINTDRFSAILYYSSYGFFFSFIYTFGFHFTMGSATVQIFYLLLFYFISKYEAIPVKLIQGEQIATY